MSSAFKMLASIAIWVLFIVGLLALISAFGRIIGGAIGAGSPELATMMAYFGVGTAGLFLSVVAIAIRNKLE